MDGNERFELIVVDDESLKTLCKYGAFIVPFGRCKKIRKKYFKFKDWNFQGKGLAICHPEGATNSPKDLRIAQNCSCTVRFF